jgi:hypothetical protein
VTKSGINLVGTYYIPDAGKYNPNNSATYEVDKGISPAGVVIFSPTTKTGETVSITVIAMPAGGTLYIGPYGADKAPLTVTIDTGGLGVANPSGTLTGTNEVRLGAPFSLSYMANAAYPFTGANQGWEAVDNDSESPTHDQVVAQWTPPSATDANEDGYNDGNDTAYFVTVNGESIPVVDFEPANADGSNVMVTIKSDLYTTLKIQPLGADRKDLPVSVSVGTPPLGTTNPAAGQVSGIRQGFA